MVARTMRESEAIKLQIKNGKLDKAVRMINQTVSTQSLQAVRDALVSDQELAGPMHDEITAEVDERIKVLES